jgi:hypothetical protein
MAGKSLPGIIIKFGAQTQDAISGINRVNRALGTSATAAQKSQARWSAFSKAFAGIGVGVGLAAIGNQMLEMGRAAAEDQKSVAALGKTLENLGLAGEKSGIEDFIESMMLATGVADDQLRPAMSSLLLATGDTAKAQSALALALDISASTGRDLQSVSLGLAKGWSGSTTALARLGVGLDKALLKSGDMVAVTEALTTKFGGQAATAAATYAGQIQRVQTAAAEAQETVGYELLKAAEDVSKAFGGTDGLVGSITAAGDRLADFVAGVGLAVEAMSKLKVGTDEGGTSFLDFAAEVYRQTPGLGLFITMTEGIADAGSDARKAEEALNDEVERSIQMRHIYAPVSAAAAAGTDQEARSADKAADAMARLNKQFDKRNSLNRGIIGDRIALRQSKQKGPGKNADSDERKQWALGIAADAASLAQGFINKGQLVKARNVLSNNREFISGQVGDRFANNVLGTPKSLTQAIAARRQQASANGASEWRRNAAPIYKQEVTVQAAVTVQSPAELVSWVKKQGRLAALGRGLGDNNQQMPFPTTGWGGIQ